METKVRKVGNALGIILPKNLVALDEKFEIEQQANRLVLTPKKENDFYAAAEPLQYHREEEWKTVTAEGDELW